MEYSDGHEAELGDIAEISDDMQGTVAVPVKEGVALGGFAPDESSYLHERILIETNKVGLVHYSERHQSSLVLASRAAKKSGLGE